MKINADKIKHLHTMYCKLTGHEVSLDMARESAWFRYTKRGLDEHDLMEIIAYYKKLIKEGKKKHTCLLFRYFSAWDWVEEDLAEKRARDRAKTRKHAPGKASVLRQTARPDEKPQDEAKSAAEIMASERALRFLQEWREAHPRRGSKAGTPQQSSAPEPAPSPPSETSQPKTEPRQDSGSQGTDPPATS